MERSFIIGLLQDIVVLLSFSLLYDMFWLGKVRPKTYWFKLLYGFVTAAFGLLLILMPWNLATGIFFDSRSILLSVAALFLGFIPSVVAAILLALYRMSFGGPGVYMGVAVILSSVAVGLLWRYFRPQWELRKVPELLYLGLTTHVVMMLCTFFLPLSLRVHTAQTIAPYVLIVYPLGTLLLGLLMLKQLKNRKNELALVDSEKELKKFASHLQHIREEERMLLAREIHDDLGQSLVALKIDLGLLKRNCVEMGNNKQPEVLSEHLDRSLKLLDETIKSSRRIMSNLRPELLEIVGLPMSLRQLTLDFTNRYHIVCDYDTDVEDIGIDLDRSLAVFRIVQEALSNVAKHALPTQVNVSFKKYEGGFLIRVSDNGKGFDTRVAAKHESYGLIGMKERTVMLGAELKINSSVNQGTVVEIFFS